MLNARQDILELASLWRGIAAVLAGCFTEDTKETRKERYNIYRLINLIHMTTYLEIDRRLRKVTSKRLKAIGILTAAEDQALAGRTSHKADVCIALLTSNYVALVNSGRIPANIGNAFASTIIRCQETMHKIKNYHSQRLPESAVTIMHLALDIFHVLLIVILPLSLNVDESCFQGITLLGVFLLSLCYSGLMKIAHAIRDPFTGDAERVNVDAVLSDTELWTFWCLRMVNRNGTNALSPGSKQFDFQAECAALQRGLHGEAVDTNGITFSIDPLTPCEDLEHSFTIGEHSFTCNH